MNNEHLLNEAKKLNPAALETLHQQCYSAVFRYIQVKVGQPQTVEDLSSEVFIRVIESLKRGRGWQDSPCAWIMGIARHVVADYYRKQERVNEVMLDEQVSAPIETDPVRQALLSDRQQHLLAAINQLTDDQRDVVLMRFMKGINIEGVAQAVGKKPGAVKGLQHRALKALAEMMSPSVIDEYEPES